MSLAGKEIVRPANVLRRLEPSKAARNAFETSPARFGGAGPFARDAQQRKSFLSDDGLRPLSLDGEDFVAQQSVGIPDVDGQSNPADLGTSPGATSVGGSIGTNAGSSLVPKPSKGATTTPPKPPPTAKEKSHQVLAVLVVVVFIAVVASKVLR